jgi:hypothetical protein
MISTKPVPINVTFSIRDNLHSDSNITEHGDRHSQEPFSRKTSIDTGRMILIKPVPSNAHPSIRDNLDPYSNGIEENDLHEEKHSTRIRG